MSLKLPVFQSGRPLLEQVTADKLNQLVDAIRQCEVQGGVGYDVSRGPGGATLTIRQQGHQYAATGTGALKLVGPANSGMSHTDASVVVNPGVESYNFQCKTPTGSYTTAFVHGVTYSSTATFNTANDFGINIALVSKRALRSHLSTVITLAENNLVRRIGQEATFSGNVEKPNHFTVTTKASLCAALPSNEYIVQLSNSIVNDGFNVIPYGGFYYVECGNSGSGNGVLNLGSVANIYTTTTGVGGGKFNCSGTTYIAGQLCTNSPRIAFAYYTFDSPVDLAGSFREDTGAGETAPTGNYSYKRTFDLGSISAASVKLRVKARLGSGPTQSFVSVKLNGVNASYTNFETQTATDIPMEISDGFVSGVNEIEFLVTNSSSSWRPSVSFEFLPTTATISAATGFASLTDAQKDLIGDGTPVQVNSVPTSSLHAYNGSGDKGTTASYTFVRNV